MAEYGSSSVDECADQLYGENCDGYTHGDVSCEDSTVDSLQKDDVITTTKESKFRKRSNSTVQQKHKSDYTKLLILRG